MVCLTGLVSGGHVGGRGGGVSVSLSTIAAVPIYVYINRKNKKDRCFAVSAKAILLQKEKGARKVAGFLVLLLVSG